MKMLICVLNHHGNLTDRAKKNFRRANKQKFEHNNYTIYTQILTKFLAITALDQYGSTRQKSLFIHIYNIKQSHNNKNQDRRTFI